MPRQNGFLQKRRKKRQKESLLGQAGFQLVFTIKRFKRNSKVCANARERELLGVGVGSS